MRIDLMPATKDNCRQCFNLRNSELVRQNCFYKAEIEYKNHILWFKEHLKSIEIITADLFFAGFIVKGDFLSIFITENFRGKGIGTKVLKLLDGKAVVLNNNPASMKAFDNAGWRRVGIAFEKQ